MQRIPLAFAAAALGLAIAAGGAAEAETLYECSGVGLEERAAAETIPHSVRVIYAQKDGSYLGGVETKLNDATGTEILSVRCSGP